MRVRRFLVRDRVLVRIVPARPWRGRYWILDRIDRFDELVRALETRGPTVGASRAGGDPVEAAEELVDD